MNAIQVLRRGLRVFHLILLRQSGVGVAGRARVGEIQLENGGIRVLGLKDGMRTMTIPAVRCARRTQRMAHPMNARGIFTRRTRVTSEAIWRSRRHVVVRMLIRNVTVATDAGVGLMDGPGKLRLIYEQGDLFARGVGLKERLV